MSLDYAIRLTLWAHKWYWDQVWGETCGDSKARPHIYLLHGFFAQHQSQLVSYFESYKNWEAVLNLLGRPDMWRGTLGAYLPYSERYARVNACFKVEENKPKRRRYQRYKTFGGKWQKKWEPTLEQIEQRREAREKKKQWRSQLGKDRDRRKRYWHRGPGRWYKKARSQNHRAWIKTQLSHGNWEVFFSKERDLFFDPWCWD